MFKRRKGSLLDLIVPIISFMAIVITSILLYKLVILFTDGIRTSLLNTTVVSTSQNLTNGINDTINYTQRASKIFPNSVPLILMGIYFGSILLARRVSSDPIFFPIALLLMIVYGFISIFGANFLWEFLNSSSILATANLFPTTVSIVRYFGIITTVMGFIILAVIYSKGDASGTV